MVRRKDTPRQTRRNAEAAREGMSEDQLILQEAKERFKRAEDWESEFWRLYVMDVKFANGDSDNGWQWPDDLRRDRETNKRPTLTINKVGPLCRLITNDQRQNKSGVTIRPANNRASFDAAQIYEGLVRQIEYASNAQSIYDDVGDSQVEGGIGWCKLETQFIDDPERPFDQEIVIKPVAAHRNVYLDCDIKQRDGSDAKWGFEFDDVEEDAFYKEHGNIDVSSSEGLSETDNWAKAGYVRVASYYRIKETPDEYIWIEDRDGNQSTFMRSQMPEGVGDDQIKEIEKEDPTRIKRRKFMRKQLEWYKIAGNKIIKRNLELPGEYVPLFRAVGIERVIDGKLERKGHVRMLKDQQRMYNYNSSGQVEFGALQTKTPWVVAAAAIQGQETAWNNANTKNAAYLTFRHRDKDGGEIPPPQRTAAPGSSPAFTEGMEIADRELMQASGQYQASQGRPGNETSGKAIQQRQRQGDTAVYHFIDGMALMIRHIGKVILSWSPKIYDTERVQQILGMDGKQQQVKVDPTADKAYQKVDEDKDDVSIIFNPSIGKYDVVSDPGPSYATRRQDAFNAFTQITMSAPSTLDDIGDFMFQNADFPNADKIAERFRRKLHATRPWMLDDNEPGPVIQELTKKSNELNQQVAELLEKLGDTTRKLHSRDQKRDIEAFRAESDRIKHFGNTVKDLVGDPKSQRMLMNALQDLLRDINGENIAGEINREQGSDGNVGHAALQPDQQGQGEDSDEQPPVPNARKAPDGQWYVPNPHSPGKYLRVRMNGAAHA